MELESIKAIKKRTGSLPILQKYELLDRINQLENLRDKALVSFLYLSGCRISEVCRYVVQKKLNRTLIDKKTKTRVPAPIPVTERKGAPIQIKQIEVVDDFIRVYNVRTLKRRQDLPRTIPIPIMKENEKPLVNFIMDYIRSKDPNDFLFLISRQRASKILEKIGLYNHYLRHLRLTHLSTEYGFSAAEIKKFVNWSSSITADSYVHLNIGDLLKKMRESK